MNGRLTPFNNIKAIKFLSLGDQSPGQEGIGLLRLSTSHHALRHGRCARGSRHDLGQAWTTPVRGMVPLAGLEPAQAAYLALTGYKTAALTIELQGRAEDADPCIRK
jgi:hypothetical protein